MHKHDVIVLLVRVRATNTQTHKTVKTVVEECSKTEANVEDGTARFTTQNGTVFVVGSGSSTLEWVFTPFREGNDVCGCET